jgi:hypothetical protein
MAPSPVTEVHPISLSRQFNPTQHQYQHQAMAATSASTAVPVSASSMPASGAMPSSSVHPNLTIQPPQPPNSFDDVQVQKHNNYHLGLHRASSLSQMHGQHQLMPQNPNLGGSFYQFPSTTTSVQSNPQFPTLQRFPSVARVNSFTNLHMLFDDNSNGASRRSPTGAGGSGSFSFASDNKTLMPTSSYLCMKSIIEDSSNPNGMHQTLGHKNSHNALQQLLDDERRRGNGASPGLGPFNGMLSQSLRSSRLSQCSIPNFSPGLPSLSPTNAGLTAPANGGGGADSDAVAKAMNSLVRTASSGRLLGGADMIAAAAAANLASRGVSGAATMSSPMNVTMSLATNSGTTSKRGGGAKGAKGKLKRKQPSSGVGGGAAGAAKVRRVSEYRGVSFHSSSGNWRARIKVNGNSKHLGYFKDEHEAAVAYDKAAFDLFGEKAPNNTALREANLLKLGQSAAGAAAGAAGATGATSSTKTTKSRSTKGASAASSASATTSRTKGRRATKKGTASEESAGTNKNRRQKATRVAASPQYKDDEAVMAWDGSNIDDLMSMKPRSVASGGGGGGGGSGASRAAQSGTTNSAALLESVLRSTSNSSVATGRGDDADSIGDAEVVANVSLDGKDSTAWNL